MLKKGEKIIALEVKSSLKKETLSGMNTFVKMYAPFKALVIGSQGIPIQEFLSIPIDIWFQ